MLKKIAYIFDKRQKRNVVILLFIMLIGSFVELLGVSAIMPLVTVVTDNDVINTDAKYKFIADVFNVHEPRKYVLLMAIFLIVVYIAKNLFICMQYNVQYRFIYNNQRRLSKQLFDYYIHQNYLYHTQTNVAILQRNLSNDVNFCFDVVLNMLYFVNEAIVCVVLVSYLAIVDPVTTLAIAGILLVFLGIFVLFFKKYSVRIGEETRQSSAMMNKWLLQGFAGIKEIKVMNKENYFVENYDGESKLYADLHRKQMFAAAMPKPILESVCICGLLVVMAVRIFTGEDMKAFVPVLSVFAIAAFRMLPSINRLSGAYSAVMYGKSALESVYQDVTEMNNKADIRQNEEQDAYDFVLNTDIAVEGLTFMYPEGETNVIEEAGLTIPRLKSTAIVGPSGAGKTTFADLLLGVLEPQKGRIEVDGANIYEHLRSWHKVIGYIPQVIYLMDDTIRANVAFGIPDEEIDDERVWAALKEAQIDDFVREQPDGIYSEIGDRGVRISGGQRQRIGIARALYNNPPLLVLDEATSALDNETETAVMEAIDSLHGSRTMIIIAHRLTTIRNCDVIYEVCDKKVSARNKEEVVS